MAGFILRNFLISVSSYPSLSSSVYSPHSLIPAFFPFRVAKAATGDLERKVLYFLPGFFFSPLSPHSPPWPKGASPIVFSIQTLHGMFLSRGCLRRHQNLFPHFLLITNSLPIIINPVPFPSLSLSLFFFVFTLFYSPLILHIFWGWVWTFSFLFFQWGRWQAGERLPFIVSSDIFFTSILFFSLCSACKDEVDFDSLL